MDNLQKKTVSTKLWGGRFSEKTATSVEAFTASIHFDCRLYRQDILGSQTHARMLAKQKLITDDECAKIQQGLSEILDEIEHGEFIFKPELEDVHMNIEKALVDKIGSAGERLHTARSRNDQVALDIRLYLRDVSKQIIELLSNIQRAFVRLARKYHSTIMPGYTHLQRAQPVLVAHHMLAYNEMFGRDKERITDGLKRINIMPLGSAAMAGSGLPIDREFVAKQLGFDSVSRNSMDSVADRDFALEFVSACTIIQLHLSRLSEELVLWATEEFSFIKLSDSFCTGSSIMPQKKNPDIPELIRGKSGRVTGNLMALITIVKGLPMTYNRDLQEDKEPVFDTIDTVSQSLAIMAELLENMQFNEERLQSATIGGYMTATDLADYLVKKNIPFRRAHSIVGQTVAYGIETGKELIEMSLTELKQFDQCIEEDVFEVLSAKGSVDSRLSQGGTSSVRVAEAIQQAEKELGL